MAMSKSKIAAAQRALNTLGHGRLVVDGIMGPNTRKAIRSFQKSINVPATGRLTKVVFDRLGKVTSAEKKVAPKKPKKSHSKKANNPHWLDRGLRHIGEKEIRGSKHNPLILKWWTLIRAPFTDDETPWCAGYVGGVLESEGIRSTRSARARSYEKWKNGIPLNKPAVGCVVTFYRGGRHSGKGHVGFVVGIDQFGNLMVLGGNQKNMVSVRPFSKDRVTGYFYPQGASASINYDLPVVNSNGRLSTNEA